MRTVGYCIDDKGIFSDEKDILTSSCDGETDGSPRRYEKTGPDRWSGSRRTVLIPPVAHPRDR